MLGKLRQLKDQIVQIGFVRRTDKGFRNGSVIMGEPEGYDPILHKTMHEFRLDKMEKIWLLDVPLIADGRYDDDKTLRDILTVGNIVKVFGEIIEAAGSNNKFTLDEGHLKKDTMPILQALDDKSLAKICFTGMFLKKFTYQIDEDDYQPRPGLHPYTVYGFKYIVSKELQELLNPRGFATVCTNQKTYNQELLYRLPYVSHKELQYINYDYIATRFITIIASALYRIENCIYTFDQLQQDSEIVTRNLNHYIDFLSKFPHEPGYANGFFMGRFLNSYEEIYKMQGDIDPYVLQLNLLYKIIREGKYIPQDYTARDFSLAMYLFRHVAKELEDFSPDASSEPGKEQKISNRIALIRQKLDTATLDVDLCRKCGTIHQIKKEEPRSCPPMTFTGCPPMSFTGCPPMSFTGCPPMSFTAFLATHPLYDPRILLHIGAFADVMLPTKSEPTIGIRKEDMKFFEVLFVAASAKQENVLT